MPATLVALADAVVTALNAQTWSLIFEAKRSYRVAYTLESLVTLRVTVVPVGTLSEALDRRDWSHACEVHVGFHKQAHTDAERDSLMMLVEEVADWLRDNRLSGFPEARATSVQNDPTWSPQHLEEQQVFLSLLRVTYLVWR